MASRVSLARAAGGWFSVEPEPGDDLAQSLAVHLAERPGTDRAWRIDIDGAGRGSRSRVGTVVTAPPLGGAPGERLVAMASMPGALVWHVRAQPYAGTTDVRENVFLQLQPTRELIAACAPLVPFNGAVVLSDGTYAHVAGVGAGVAVVPAGARVRMWSATANGGPATVTIGALVGLLGGAPEPVVTIADGFAFTDEPRDLLGARSITFAGSVGEWFVGWEG